MPSIYVCNLFLKPAGKTSSWISLGVKYISIVDSMTGLFKIIIAGDLHFSMLESSRNIFICSAESMLEKLKAIFFNNQDDEDHILEQDYMNCRTIVFCCLSTYESQALQREINDACAKSERNAAFGYRAQKVASLAVCFFMYYLILTMKLDILWSSSPQTSII